MIAKNSNQIVGIAQKAADDAKAAQDAQNTAGAQASHQVSIINQKEIEIKKNNRKINKN